MINVEQQPGYEFYPVEDIVEEIYSDTLKELGIASQQLSDEEKKTIKRIVSEQIREECYQEKIFDDIKHETKKEIESGRRVMIYAKS